MMLLLVGCNNNQKLKITAKDLEDIKVELVKKEEEENGINENGINYTLKLKNKSDFIIKQNNVYLSYPIKIDGGKKGNDFKVEAEGNRLNIDPDEEVTLNVYIPHEGLLPSNLLIDKPKIEIKGFLEQVDKKHIFNIYQSLGSSKD